MEILEDYKQATRLVQLVSNLQDKTDASLLEKSLLDKYHTTLYWKETCVNSYVPFLRWATGACVAFATFKIHGHPRESAEVLRAIAEQRDTTAQPWHGPDVVVADPETRKEHLTLHFRENHPEFQAFKAETIASLSPGYQGYDFTLDTVTGRAGGGVGFPGDGTATAYVRHVTDLLLQHYSASKPDSLLPRYVDINIDVRSSEKRHRGDTDGQAWHHDDAGHRRDRGRRRIMSMALAYFPDPYPNRAGVVYQRPLPTLTLVGRAVDDHHIQGADVHNSDVHVWQPEFPIQYDDVFIIDNYDVVHALPPSDEDSWYTGVVRVTLVDPGSEDPSIDPNLNPVFVSELVGTDS